MRLDSHQHFWKYNDTDYVWMTDEMEVLRRDRLPDELASHLNRIGFDGSIAVQARQMVQETEWLLELSDRHPFIAGVVGWVDFESEQLDQQLERFSSHPKLKGVRELIHDMPDVRYAVSDAHVRGVGRLARYGLTYDLLLKPPHIHPAIELARRFPEQPFVLDHLAKPDIAAQSHSPWREDLRDLARCENVWCKLSGMATEARWDAWSPEDLRPFLDTALDAFGPERLMIGSDWPVCTLAGSYETVMGVVMDYAGRLASTEREAILGDACAQFYNVRDAQTSPSAAS